MLSLFLPFFSYGEDTVFLKCLKEKEVNGISYFKAANGKMVPVQKLTASTEGTSFSTMSRNNTEILAAMGAQGNLQQRARELVGHTVFREAAIEELCIPAMLGSKESTDLVSSLSLSNEQTRGLRQAGFKLASEREMAEEEKTRQLPMNRRFMRLQVKANVGEKVESVGVRIFSSFFDLLYPRTDPIFVMKGQRLCS